MTPQEPDQAFRGEVPQSEYRDRSAVRFGTTGYTDFGEWYAWVRFSPAEWEPGKLLQIETTLAVQETHLAGLAATGIRVDGFCFLVTAERTFDADGRLRLASDERMSTLLTPTGLAIEGGIQGAVTNRFGYGFRTPVDIFQTLPLSASEQLPEAHRAQLRAQAVLPPDLPPGIYRVRMDFGVTAKGRYYSLNGETFARRPFFKGRPTESHLYSPPLPASGRHVSGRQIDAAQIRPRVPWVLLASYNSNGYRGVVAEEDSDHFALSGRTIMPDEVILPLFDDRGNRLAYSLEPQFPADTIEARSSVPWDYTQGELSIEVTDPLGRTTDLGTAPFVGKNGQWPTTKRSAITAWKPAIYGQYAVRATGWTTDIWGNRYEGGGTYRFWIAKRMTLATATFQGVPYPVGGRYGRDIAFAPGVPADVDVNAVLYVNSDPNDARKLSFSGRASSTGVFTAAQGNKALALDAPGEYHGHVLARYVDRDGHLWVCSMRHSGVVHPEESQIVARGKKLTVKGKHLERGDTEFEGYVDTGTGQNHLAHLNYPFQSGDVLLIASEQQGANKIEPVLTWESKSKPAPYDAKLQGIGVTNVRMRTSNGYSPHLFPEHITEWAYYYASAPRPGFMSRFLVGEDGVRAPYWPTSPNSFGGQINTSANGDLPGDIYRLLGGVVIRKKGEPPLYAGYMASAFLLPRGTKNNRIVAPGSEELIGPDGRKARFFLVGTRPGMAYEAGTAFAPAVQIDPMVPATVTFTLVYPDGRQVTTQGVGDRFGTFVGKEKWVLDTAGAYRYFLEADWQGHRGYMPGLPPEGGELYVLEREKPADAVGLRLDVSNQATFSPSLGVSIKGTTTSDAVRYAALMPGAVLGQGTLPVVDGKFEFFWSPQAVYDLFPTYDAMNLMSGRPEVGDVVHLTFFSRETAVSGARYHSIARVILRGNRIVHVR